jgi:threonine synthase
VPGSRADTAAAVREAAKSAYYASHNWQPVFVQGVMTWALEVWEQLGFRAPDNIVMPVGNGSLLLGALRAFDLLIASGEVARLPRLFAVQSEAFAPLVRAFDIGLEEVPAVEGGETLAEGVAIAQPVRGPALLDAVRQSNGRAIAVSDIDISEAFRHLAGEGIFVEPVAGLRRLLGDETVGPQETTVVVLTGSGLKATEQVRRLLDP